MAYPKPGNQQRRRTPTFSSGYATHQASVGSQHWKGLAVAFAPFLGPTNNPTKLLFGSAIRPGNIAFQGGKSSAGVLGHAWEFTATTDFIKLGRDTEIFNGGDQITFLIGYRKTDTTQRNATFVAVDLTLFDNGAFYVQLLNTGGADHNQWQYSWKGNTVQFQPDATNYSHSQGHSLAVATGPSGVGNTWYVDGRFAQTSGINNGRVNAGANVFLGSTANVSGADLMVVDYLYIWNRHLTEAEISAVELDPGALFRPVPQTVSKSPFVSYSETVTETVTLTESLNTLGVFSMPVAETVTLTESLVGSMGTAAALSESVGAIGESLIGTYGAVVAPLTESVSLSESINIPSVTIRGGVTDATRLSHFSLANSYKAVHHCVALAKGPNPYLALLGGRSQVAGVTSAINLPTIFRTLSSATMGDGSIQVAYEWRRTLNVPVSNHIEHAAAVGLGDTAHLGQVLVAGGHNDWATPKANATLLSWTNLPADTWTVIATGSMGTARAGHSLTPLVDDKILVAGGIATWNTPVASAELWDPVAGTWGGTGAMSEPRLQHGAVRLADGRVLVSGGRRPFVPFAADADTFALWHLDEALGVTTAAEPVGGLTLNTAGSTQGVIAKGNRGLRLAAAASASAGARQTALNTALLAGPWTIEGWMTARQGTVVCNGAAAGGDANNVLLCLGVDGSNHFFWYWQVAGGAHVTGTSTATMASVMPHADAVTHPFLYHLSLTRDAAASGLAGKSDVMLYVNGVLLQAWVDQANPAGGATGVLQFGADVKGTFGAYVGLIDEWRLSTVARDAGAVAAAFRTQCGVTNWDDPTPAQEQLQGLVLSSAEVYAGGTWTRTGPMAQARYGHALVALASGEILAVGGSGPPAGGGEAAPLASAEIWSPTSGQWRPAGALAVGREDAAAQTLPSGLVLALGGRQASADLYDARLGRWEVAAAAPGRVRRGAVAGQVGGVLLLAGGAELTSGTWDTVEASYVLVPAAEHVAAGQAGGLERVAGVPSSTSFTYTTTQSAVGSLVAGGEATATPAGAVAGALGPFAWDPAGAAVTGIATTATVRLEAGRGHPILTVVSTAGFPDAEGFLAFRFGRSGEMRPVRYLGLLSATELRLDASFTLTSDLGPGDSVVLLAGQGVPAPATAEQGAFYVTDTPAALGAVVRLADDVVAAGIDVHKQILYPGDFGLGAAGAPTSGAKRLSGVVAAFAADPVDASVRTQREES